MSHVDEGTVLAIRDGALVSTDAELHLEECGACAEWLVSARERARRIDRTLSSLDGPVDVDSAKARVRARMDAQHPPARRTPARRWHLGRAAAILLVAAGAVYALPRSPLPSWLGFEEDVPVAGVPETTPAPQDYEGGIDVPVPAGRIEVVVRGASGAPIEVKWVDEPVARISSGAGSAYSFADGRAEATVVPGPVSIEIPRSSVAVFVEVNGRMLLEKTDSGLELSGNVLERTPDRLLFSIAQR